MKTVAKIVGKIAIILKPIESRYTAAGVAAAIRRAGTQERAIGQSMLNNTERLFVLSVPSWVQVSR